MKTIDVLKTASSNMLQSKLRTFLTVIAIFVGALTLTLTNGIGSGISNYIDKQVSNLGAKDLMVIRAADLTTTTPTTSGPKEYNPNRTVGTGFGGNTVTVMTTKDIAKIKAVPGILSVQAMRTATPDYITTTGAKKFEASLTTYFDGTNLTMDAGSQPTDGTATPQAVLPVEYVSALGLSSSADAVGKTVMIGITDALGVQSEYSVTVVGVEQKTIIGDGGIVANQPLIDALYAIQSKGLPTASTDQFLMAAARFDPSYTDAQIITLEGKLKDAGFNGTTIQDQIGILKQVIHGIVIVFDVFGIIALIAASFGVINTLLMAVQERTKEIGLMKAMGMGSGQIFLLFSTEAILLGFWGSLLGVLAAMGIGGVVNHIAQNGFLKDFDGLHLLAFPAQSVLSIMVIIMVIAFLAGTLPARRASKLNPIDALRYE